MTMIADYVIIGSGPAGIAAAKALVDRGASVAMVDVGLKIESERLASLERIAKKPFESWDAREVEQLKGEMPSDSTGVPLKLLYGSDYPYRGASEENRLKIPDGSFLPSHAIGGLSTVWGASVLPYNDRDLRNWPVSATEMEPHYRAVAEWMPIMAANDELGELYPIHAANPQPVLPSRQAGALLDRMRRNGSRLRSKGVRFGHSRIAMRSKDCAACGLCLYGCPYGLIYNSAETVDRLLASPNFRYLPGICVDRVEESDSKATIYGRELATGKPWIATGGRVFIGAGIVPTARIVLDSASYYDRPLKILDSQYTLLPLLSLKSFRNIETERLHTLCQIYLEVDDPSLSAHNIHCQLYTYSDLYRKEFETKIGGILPWLPDARRQILSRLMVALCYLHSDDSSQLTLTLNRLADSDGKRLHIDFVINPRTSSIEKRLGWKLAGLAGSLGFMPLVPMIHLANPGRGYHNGGSFPMGLRSEGPISDSLGRPFGWKRIHLIDASVFPTIPAATITYSVMANAHRIATQAMQS